MNNYDSQLAKIKNLSKRSKAARHFLTHRVAYYGTVPFWAYKNASRASHGRLPYHPLLMIPKQDKLGFRDFNDHLDSRRVMRTRSRLLPSILCDPTAVLDTNTGLVSHMSPLPPLYGGGEVMFDAINGKLWLSNPCHHDKEAFVTPVGPARMVPTSGYIMIDTAVPHLKASFDVRSAMDVSVIDPYPGGHVAMVYSDRRYPKGYTDYIESAASRHDKAWNIMSPKLNNTGTDILDFLYELPQLRSLWEDYVVNSEIWLRIKGLTSIVGKSTLSEASRLANHNLAVQFGLLPFLSDVQNLINLLVHMRERMTEFTRNAGVFQRHHWSEVTTYHDTQIYPFAMPGDFVYVQPSNRASIQFVRDITVRYSASCTYKYTIPDCQSVWNTLTKYMTYLGVSVDGSTVWNEIPFSFVVDWFYDVSKFLHQHRYDLYKVDVMLADFCYSHKSTYVISTYVHIDGVSYFAGRNTCVGYTRNRAVPKAYDDMNFGKFTINKLGLAASLAIQRLP